MRIIRLQITGFKSFADKITIPLSPGVSVIVGPNGCGKSNLVDAVKWVLGEQSPKSLRGTKMEDVIFNGADGRDPMSYAEVSLTLENEGGEAPPPYDDMSEISVARRLYRTGESHYLINRHMVRRLDVRRLFMDTGVGESPYGIMSQGEVNLVLDSRPQEMRAYLEEVAGITRFKAGRAAALRKMELTSQNLLRLEDIIGEVKRQVSRLKRQAKKAEQYKKLKAEIRQLKSGLLARAYLELMERYESISGHLKELTDKEDGVASRMKRVESDELLKRTELMEKDKELEEAREKLYELRSDLQAVESEMADIERRLREMDFQKKKAAQDLKVHMNRSESLEEEMDAARLQHEEIEQWLGLLKERSQALKEEHRGFADSLKKKEETLRELSREMGEVSQSLALLKGEVNAKTERLGIIERDEGELKVRLEELDSRKKEIAGLKEAAARDNSDASKRLGELEEKIAGLEKEIQKIEDDQVALETSMAETAATFHRTVSRLTALSEMAEKSLRPADELPDEAAQKLFSGERPLALAEVMEVQKGLEPAVDAALGEGLKALFIEGVGAVESLGEEPAPARLLLAPLDLERPGHPAPPEGSVTLKDKVTLAGDAMGGLAGHILSRTLLAGDFSHAVELYLKGRGGFQVVTEKGLLITREGIVAAGKKGEAELMGLRAEIAELEEKKGRLSKELDEAQKTRRKLRDGLEAKKAEAAGFKDEAARAREEAANAEVTLIKLRDEEDRIEEAASAAEERAGHLREEAGAIRRFLEEARGKEERLKKRDGELKAGQAEETEAFEELRAQEEAAKKEFSELDVEEAGLRERLSGINREKERITRFTRETEERIGQLKEEISQAETESGEKGERLEALKKTLPQKYEALEAQEEVISSLREVHSRESLELGKLEEKKAELARELNAVSQERSEAQASFTETEVGLKYLVKRGMEHLRVDVSKEGAARSLADELPQAAESRVELLEERVGSLGPVNLTALDELEEEQRRLEFLTSQHDDLVESKKSLREAISRIDKATKGRLLNTLERVNEKLNDVFPLLFDGGEATLAFTEPANPLESGVAYLLRPPGKRLSTLTLLSGGEKALAALALLFSFYMIRPSPFLILDEVDAALDDANLERFLKLLKKVGHGSQLVAITHKKRTMELADTLLGVTMEEPGVSKMISVTLKGEELV